MKHLTLFLLFAASLSAATFRTIKGPISTIVIDQDRIVAIESYIVYVSQNAWFEPTEDRAEAIKWPDIYKPQTRGSRIILSIQNSQVAVGGQGLLSGGDATNRSASVIIVFGLTPEEVLKQLNTP